MKLFSKRNKGIYSDEDSRYSINRRIGSRRELINNETRNRIIAEIKFLTSSNDFLEWFILFENQKKEKIFFDKAKIDNFSLSELGYRMSDYFEFEDFSIVHQEQKSKITEEIEKFFDDYKLFDLVEIVILFSIEKKRIEVINRFNGIFSEENSPYQIVEHLITRKSGETIKTLVNLLKDENLANKIKNFFDFYDDKDFINSAKISSEILNIIFSGYIKNNKPKYIAEIKEKILEKIIINTTKKEDNTKAFSSHLDDLLKISKNLSNDIYDVRHTEKSTIKLSNDNIYKLISNQNISLAELVLTTLKDDYVLGDNWEKIKEDYIAKYNIDKSTRLIIEKPAIKQEELDFNDIPF